MSSEENDKTTPQVSSGQGTPIRDEIAVMLRRIIDRVLPELRGGGKCAPALVRYGTTFLGTLFWFSVFGFLMLWFAKAPDKSTSDAFAASRIFGAADIADFIIGSPWHTLYLCILVCLIFTWLIGTTFRHGRPLTFFFCGLIYLSLAVSIVKYAFLY